MTEPRSGVCSPYATAEDVYDPSRPGCSTKYADLDPYILADALEDASNLLWRKTGNRYPGICIDTVRPPCGRRFSTYVREWGPESGTWHGSQAYCGCSSPCGCDGPERISLGRVPIVEILEVTVDGEVLPSSRYRVDDYRWLVRLPDADGSNPGWPAWQNMSLPTTEVGTWSVYFSYGRTPPGELVRAAAWMAGEWALSRCGGPCDLPPGLTNVQREGLTFALQAIPDDVWTTLPKWVRMAVETANPNSLSRAPVAWSPDGTPPPVRTNTGV